MSNRTWSRASGSGAAKSVAPVAEVIGHLVSRDATSFQRHGHVRKCVQLVDTGSDDYDPTCEAGVSLGPVQAGRGRSKAHQTSITLPTNVSNIALDYGNLEDKQTLSEQEAGPSPILLTISSTTRVTTADVLPCMGAAHPCCVQALVRAIGSGRSESDPSIRQRARCHTAGECRVRHGMTVLGEASEYEPQDAWQKQPGAKVWRER